MTEHPSGPGRLHVATEASTEILSGRKRRDWRHFAALSTVAITVAIVAVGEPFVGSAGAGRQTSAATCPAGGCTVTVQAFGVRADAVNNDPGIGEGLAKGNPLPAFNFIINQDNTRLPLGAHQADGSVTTRPTANGYAHTESYSPLVREGGCATLACDGPGDRKTVKLPTGRYLITVRAPDHKMWGQLITLPRDAGAADIVLTEASEAKPLPLGSNRVIVFEDNGWTNGAPDAGEHGLQGFTVQLFESTYSQVTVDYHNKPLCSDPKPSDPAPGSWPNCETDSDGFVQIDKLSPANYFTEVVPPPGPCNSNPASQWYQTTTIDGGLDLGTPVEEGASGAGPPTALAADLAGKGAKRTVNWFGFVCAPVDIANPGSGEISGTARNEQPWTNGSDVTFGDPIENPLVSLTDATTNETIYVGRGDASGNFDIQGVPAGTYHVSIWDEQLSYIMRFLTVTVGDGQAVDLNTTDSSGESGTFVPRWFGWLDGHVYKDTNGNGMMDPGEPGIGRTDVDLRWRDGSIKESTTTDPTGYYQYPTAEGGALGKWIIGEQGFSHFSSYPGPSIRDSQHPDDQSRVIPSCSVVPPFVPANPCIPVDQGGGLLTNQLLQPDQRATVDWGKRDYPAGTPGQIVGITYFATTRNEFLAYKQSHEDYEPGIPDVEVLLETPGPDNTPNTADDVVVNKYVTDHWQGPARSQDPQDPPGNSFSQSCSLRDSAGNDVTNTVSHWISDLCIEQPVTGVQTKDGAFDGGYAFADYCPNGYDMAADDGTCNGGTDPVPLVAGTYITHAIMPKDSGDGRACNPANPNGFKRVSSPKGVDNIPGGGDGCLWRPVREEDVNVDLGNQYETQLPQPPCTGDQHVIDQSTLVTRSNYYTGNQGTSQSAPLCDKRLVELHNNQNANADFYMMTNFNTDPNGANAGDNRAGDVAEPGRVVGVALNDLKFETDPNSILFGDNAGVPGVPVGIYARYDDNPNHWRLFTTVTTSDVGSYEALLPSTETFNCPIPQGPCPGMYRFLVDDPGTPNHPNASYDPGYLRGTDYIFDVWPGQTNNNLDTPLIPSASGANCQTPSGKPELLQVSRPYVTPYNTTAATRRITISGVGFGTTPGTVTLADPRGGGQSRTLGPAVNPNPSVAAGGVVSWSDRQIVIQVPQAAGSFPAGQKQLSITENGRTSENGITIHVLGSGYNPVVVNVPAWDSTTHRHAIQDALDTAAPGSLLVLSPGTYYESVVMWKPVKIQGLGVGGTVGAENLLATNPGDPRFAIPGSVIDGRYFGSNRAAWDVTVAAHANAGSPRYQGAATLADVLAGADVLVLAQTATDYGVPAGVFSAARIDGIGLVNGGGNPGAGGVQLQAQANNTQITNNVLQSNSGSFAGGIGIGKPGEVGSGGMGSHNFNVGVFYDRVIGNGSASAAAAPAVEAGGVGIFNGSNSYEIANSLICSNATGEPDSPGFGGGISHFGRSPNGKIHDNQIVFNTAIESGGGISIQQQAGTTVLGGTGNVDVDRNVIQTNVSGNDGGGILVRGALNDQINIRNNMINDNLASDMGGAIMLHDSTRVRIVNNTVANNASTASAVIGGISETPHSAGLAVDQNSPSFQATLPVGSPDFSNPEALFNNIFWENQAYTLDVNQPLSRLIDHGFIDFEVFGALATDTLTPRYSDLTDGKILLSDGTLADVPAGQQNTSGDPKFVSPFKLVLAVGASRFDPTVAMVTINGVDPADEGLFGDYHIVTPASTAAALASLVIDRGAGFSDFDPPPPPTKLLPTSSSTKAPCSRGVGESASQFLPADFERQWRPVVWVLARLTTPWDIGADEVQHANGSGRINPTPWTCAGTTG